MNEKILLINPPYKSQDIIYFPLGLGYIASACAQAGIDVECLDLNLNRLSSDKIRTKIINNQFHVVGIGGFATQLKSTIDLSNLIKDICHDTVVIVGGIQVHGCDDFILNNSRADIVVIGESEHILPDLIHQIYKGNNFNKFPSIKYKYNNSIIGQGDISIVENISNLPFPKYDSFDMDEYIKNNYHNVAGKRTIDFICSRGCPYKCSYCINSKKPVKVRYRSIDNILAEIRYLKENYKIDDFSFADEIFTINKNKALEICEALKTENITWITSVRADGINEQLLSAMKNSGCRLLLIGYESGSEKILKTMNKRANMNDYNESIKLLRKYDMNFFPNFMIGMPGETEETIQETEDFCINNGLIFGPSYVTPFPGTKLYEDIINTIDEKDYLIKLYDLSFSKKPIINLTNIKTSRLIYLRNRTTVNSMIAILNRKLKFMPTIFLKLILWCYLLIFNMSNPIISKFTRSINKIIRKII